MTRTRPDTRWAPYRVRDAAGGEFVALCRRVEALCHAEYDDIEAMIAEHFRDAAAAPRLHVVGSAILLHDFCWLEAHFGLGRAVPAQVLRPGDWLALCRSPAFALRRDVAVLAYCPLTWRLASVPLPKDAVATPGPRQLARPQQQKWKGKKGKSWKRG